MSNRFMDGDRLVFAAANSLEFRTGSLPGINPATEQILFGAVRFESHGWSNRNLMAEVADSCE